MDTDTPVDTDDTDPPMPLPQLTAFVTSSSGTGNLGSWPDAGSGLPGVGGFVGLDAADAICQAHASRAGLSGTYVAWLSDASTDAY